MPTAFSNSNYQIINVLGQGATGNVYLGKNINTNELVAIKKLIITPEISQSESIFRFKREALIIKKLNHKNIIKIFDVEENDNNIFLIMEYYEGKSLKEVFSEFCINEKVTIIKIISETLSYIHDNNIIHRDIKPDNILVKKNSQIDLKIIDFGLAYLNDYKEIIKRESIVGSFSYISPEQTGLLRRPVDRRSDLYSLGATFYQLLTNRPPFIENDIGKLIHKHLAVKPKAPSYYNQDVPKILDNIILKLLAKEPDERYQNADGLTYDINCYLDDSDNSKFIIGLGDKSHKINYQIKLIGREEELNILKTNFEDVKKGQSRFILLNGPSGSGKTKIVTSFFEELTNENILLLNYKCSKESKNIPYSVISSLINELLKKENFFNEIIKIDPDLYKIKQINTLFPFLFDKYKKFLSKNKKSSLKLKDKEQIFKILKDFFDQIYLTSYSIIFFIDDIQWIDQDSLEVINYFKSNPNNNKLMFVFAIVEDQLTYLKEKKLCDDTINIFVKPLEKEQIPVFIKKMLLLKNNFKNEFYDKISDESLCNPFFILEIVKSLYDIKILYYENKQWKINYDKLTNFHFDKDISKMLINRIKSFSEEEIKILTIASVIGKEFNIDLLNNLVFYLRKLNDENLKKNIFDEIITVIDKAREKQLLKEDLSLGKGVYCFVHDQIIELLNKPLSKEDKDELHLICALTIENIYKKNPDKVIYQLAYHYNYTARKEKKYYYNELAYKKSISQYSVNQTIYYLKKLIDLKFDDNNIDENLIKLIIEMAEYAFNSGNMQIGLEYIEKALIICNQNRFSHFTVNLNLLMGRGYYYLNNMAEAIKYYQIAIEDAKIQNIEIKDALPYRLIGSSYWFAFDMINAEEFLSKAIKYVDKNDWENKVPIYGIRGWTYALMGEIKKTLDDVKIIEKDIKYLKNPVLLAQVHHVCAGCYGWSCNYKKGIQHAYKAYEIAKESKNLLYQYSSLASRAIVYIFNKDYEKAENAINEAIEISKKHNILIGVYLLYSHQVEIALWKKEYEKAFNLSNQYMHEKDYSKDRFPILIFIKAKAFYYYFNNQYSDCLSVLDEGISIYEQTAIALTGISLLMLKIKVLELLKQDNSNIKSQLNELEKKEGIGVLFDRSIELILLLEEAKREKNIESSRSSSASVFKEKLQLGNLIKTSQNISSILNIDELLNEIMLKTVEITGAERGALLLYNKELNDFEYKVVHNSDESDKLLKVSNNILENVKKSKKGIIFTLDDKMQPFKISNSIIAQNIKSIICAPLIIKDDLIGILYLDSKLLNQLFIEEDLELLNIFTTQAAISIENARLHIEMLNQARVQQEMAIARDIQTSLLPFINDTDNYDIAAFMQTATEVGGDYYDIYTDEEPFFGVFGDVSGHGLKSGLVMMMAEVAFNFIIKDTDLKNQPLDELYQKINLTLYQNLKDKLAARSKMRQEYNSIYMTLRLFRFNNSGNFEIFGNDHAEPFIVRKDSRNIETIESKGFLIGMIKDAKIDEKTIHFKLNSGDMVVFYSDGITEAKRLNKQERLEYKPRDFMFGKNRLYEIIINNRNSKPDVIIDKVIEKLKKYMFEQEDDITLMIIKKK